LWRAAREGRDDLNTETAGGDLLGQGTNAERVLVATGCGAESDQLRSEQREQAD
jgi:hypothetical protein